MVANGDVIVVEPVPVVKMNHAELLSLAEQFVLQYYSVMSDCPNVLHQFYGPDSTLILESLPIHGQGGIAQMVSTLDLKNVRVIILNIDALLGHQNSVLVQVAGEISTSGGPFRRFTRSFTLVETSAGNFYVINDIVRYQDRVYIHEDSNSATAPNNTVFEEKGSARHAEKVSSNGEVSEQKRLAEEKLPELPHQTLNQETETQKEEAPAPARTPTPKLTAESPVEKQAPLSVPESQPTAQPEHQSQQSQQHAPVPNTPMSWAQRASGNVAASPVVTAHRNAVQQPKQAPTAQPLTPNAQRGGAVQKSNRGGGRPQQRDGEARKEQNTERNEQQQQRSGFNQSGGSRGGMRGGGTASRGNRGGQAHRGGPGGFRGASNNGGPPAEKR